MPRRSCAISASTTFAVVEVNQPHAHTRRRRRQERPDRRRDGRPAVAGRQGDRGPQADRRDRRVDPAAARRTRQRGEVPQRRDRPARRPDHHRPARAPRPARLPQDAARQGDRLRAAPPVRPATSRSPPRPRSSRCDRIARRIGALDREIADLDRQLEPARRAAAPRTIQLLGISTGHAGQLLVTAGQNIDRLRGEGAFAALCGASPIPASSGKTTRHRLNYGGDRQANRALHLIAVCRLRYCPRTRAYANAAPPKARPSARSSAASSATSPARSTTPSAPTSPTSTHQPRPHARHHHHLRRRRPSGSPEPHLTSIGTSQDGSRNVILRDCCHRGALRPAELAMASATASRSYDTCICGASRTLAPADNAVPTRSNPTARTVNPKVGDSSLPGPTSDCLHR